MSKISLQSLAFSFTKAFSLVDISFSFLNFLIPKTNAKFEASTSQSTLTIFLFLANKTAKEAAIELFPTPPLPDKTVMVFI